MQNLFKPKQALLALALALAPTLIYAQTQSGALDPGFGAGGKVTTDFGGSEGVSSLALQPDEKIVAAGGAFINGSSAFALARYNRDGALDAGFGAGGEVTTNFGGRYERATSVALQPDGKIVAVGQSVLGLFNDFALARYNSNGTLDASFGTDGKVITDFGVSAAANSVAVQPDGKIVVAGEANIDGNYEFAVVRYNSNGALDNSFGAGGKVTTDFGLLEQGFSYIDSASLAIQWDGKIVVAGKTFIGGGFDIALARYNSDGTLDASFGAGGKVTTDLGGPNDGAFSVAVQADGKIVASGMANVARGLGFALARYNSNGTLDASFGAGGVVISDFGLLTQGFSNAVAFAVAIRPDGKIVTAGRAFINGDFHSALARYNSDGALDTSFGADGKVTNIFGGESEGVSSVAVQQDGKIVVAGGAAINWVSDFALARYN